MKEQEKEASSPSSPSPGGKNCSRVRGDQKGFVCLRLSPNQKPAQAKRLIARTPPNKFLSTKTCKKAAKNEGDEAVTRRYSSCRIFEGWAVHKRTIRGRKRIVGTTSLTLAQLFKTRRKGKKIGHFFAVSPHKSTGTFRRGSRVYGRAECLTYCRYKTDETWHEGVEPLKVASKKWKLKGRLGKKNKRTPLARVKELWVVPKGVPLAKGNPTMGPVNSTILCSDVKYLKPDTGCSFLNVKPTFKLRRSNPKVGESAKFIRRAQRKLKDHWGWKGHGKALSRWRWKGKGKNPNRKESCRGFKKRSKHDSCDEYPFASTKQGAYFKGRKRTARAHVRLSDNRNAGSHLARFYNRERILAGDKFWVRIAK